MRGPIRNVFSSLRLFNIFSFFSREPNKRRRTKGSFESFPFVFHQHPSFYILSFHQHPSFYILSFHQHPSFYNLFFNNVLLFILFIFTNIPFIFFLKTHIFIFIFFIFTKSFYIFSFHQYPIVTIVLFNVVFHFSYSTLSCTYTSTVDYCSNVFQGT